MHSVFLRGVILAALVGLLAAISGPLALESIWPLLIATAVAFVPGLGLAGRLGAFAFGLVAGWLAFMLRAGVFPDIPLGRALFIAIPVLVVAAVAALSRERLPLWAGLAGLVTFGAAYHPVFAASPSDFAAQSVATMTSVLLATGLGGVAAMLLRPSAAASETTAAQATPSSDAPVTGTEEAHA